VGARKSGSGGVRARNKRLYKEKHQENYGFLRVCQNGKSGSGGIRARKERFSKEKHEEL